VSDTFQAIARALDGSAIQGVVLYLLNNVPGFPPIVQTVHLLSIAVIMGSIVLVDLKVLGLALGSQKTGDLVRRLMPWMWSALPILAASGLVFVIARPHRYFVNPVFGLKFTMLLPTVVLAAVFHRLNANDPRFWEGARGRRAWVKIVAGLSLLLWIGVVRAGRWIAYADYFFEM
jgi:uncharacterized protein DUF6644